MDEEVIPVLYVKDAARAVACYARLGFQKEWEHQFGHGFPMFLSVARGRVRLYLSEHVGDARPNTLIHLNVSDIEAVAKEFGLPVDEDGLAGRECDLEDPDGNRLRVATRARALDGLTSSDLPAHRAGRRGRVQLGRRGSVRRPCRSTGAARCGSLTSEDALRASGP